MISDTDTKIDTRGSSGLVSMCFAARLLGINIRPVQFFGKLASQERGSIYEILSAAKILDFKTGVGEFNWNEIKRLSFPIIAQPRPGHFIVFTNFNNEKIVAFDPNTPNAPVTIDQHIFNAFYSKKLVLLRKKTRDSDQRKPFGLPWLFNLTLPYKKTFFEILIAALAVQIFSLAIPLFSQVIVDKVLNHNSKSMLYILGMGMLIIAVFECVIGYLQAYLNVHTASRIDITLNSRVFSHLLRLPLRYFENRTAGHIIAHMREIEALKKFLTNSTVGVIVDTFFITIFVCVMLVYSIKLTVVALTTIPITLAITMVSYHSLLGRLNEKFGRNSEMQSFLFESISGIQTAKSLGIESSIYLKWRDLIAQHIQANNKVEQINQISGTTNQITQRLTTIAILWIGANEVMNGELTIGQLIAFQMIAMRIAQPIVRLAKSWHDFRQMGISAKRLGDIMDRPAEAILRPSILKKASCNSDIEIQNLTYKYPESGKVALENISLTINTGQVIGIVGRSGSGKSTLVKLLLGLYKPTSGTIKLGKTDIQLADPAQLKREIGVVLQESFLFNGTIRANICIKYPNAPHDSVVQASKLAGAHDFVEELPKGYDTWVGERGDSLSGGQRQRISIARALLGEPPILVFDEATSALDYESENIVRSNLKMFGESRTTIIIAHRLSTVQSADKIFVLDNGRLAEQGTHSELMKLNGLYCHLYSQQKCH